MAVVWIDPVRPRVPDTEAVLWGAPVRGPTMQAIADGTNHLLGWQFRRAVHRVIDHDTTAGKLDSQTPVGVAGTHRVWWTSSPFAVRVAAVIDYQAWYSATTGKNPSIDASLYLKGGARIDSPAAEASGGMVWQYADGTLPSWVAHSETIPGAPGWYATTRYPALSVTTGTPAPGAIDTDPDYPTRPRPFEVGAHAGSALEVRIVATDVRVLAVDLWEMWLPTVDQ